MSIFGHVIWQFRYILCYGQRCNKRFPVPQYTTYSCAADRITIFLPKDVHVKKKDSMILKIGFILNIDI